MESGEWRLVEGESVPWTDRPPAAAPAPDLWGDDSPDTWVTTQAWQPRRPAEATRPDDRTGGYGPPPGAYGPASYGPGGYAPYGSAPPDQAVPGYGQPQYAPDPAGPPSGLIPPESGPRHRSLDESPSGSIRTQSAPRPAPRPALRPAPPPASPPAPPPALGRVFGLTATWYAIPTIAYLIWLVAFSDDRPGGTGTRQVSGTFPWLVAAIAVSLALALVLRRLTVGWRSLGVSFAAAVIGAGLATIIHSFAT